MQKRWYLAHSDINLPAFFYLTDNVFIFQFGLKFSKVAPKLFASLSCFIPWERLFLYEIILAWWECIILLIFPLFLSYTGWVKRLWSEYGSSCWNDISSYQKKKKHSALFWYTLLEKHTFVSLFIHQPVPPSVSARLVVYHRIDAEAVPNLTETHIEHFWFEHYTELSIRCYTWRTSSAEEPRSAAWLSDMVAMAKNNPNCIFLSFRCLKKKYPQTWPIYPPRRSYWSCCYSCNKKPLVNHL